MKKLYFLLIVTLFFSTVRAQIITIPDANFKERLLDANASNSIAFNEFGFPMIIDANNNGEIEVNEALLVRKLNISNSNINSLEGISGFTNLRTLECINNNLTTLNLNALLNLRILNCSYNQLTLLSCEEIDNKMKFLDCSHNNLQSFNVPNFYEFEDQGDQDMVLNCSFNQLSNIVFTSNINGSISIGEDFSSLNLSNNSFTSLILNNINVYGALNLSNNPLTNLTFGTNFGLSSQQSDYPYGFFYLDNTNLTELYIPFDISAGSTISNNSLLTNLNLKNNKYNVDYTIYTDENEVETIEYYFITIENNPLLTTICCDVNEFSLFAEHYPSVQMTSNCDLDQIVNIPDSNLKIRLLTASTTNNIAKNALNNAIKVDLNNDGEIQISEALLVYSLNVNSTTNSQKIANLEGLQYFQYLKFLQCQDNIISQLNVSQLFSLEELNIDNNNLVVLNAYQLKNLSASNNQLATLNLLNCHNLQSINVSNNPLESINVNYLTNLEMVNISNTNISTFNGSSSGVKQFICENNSEITNINLKNDIYSFSDPDLLFFAFRIQNNPNLMTICTDDEEQNNLAFFNYNTNGNVIVYNGENCDIPVLVNMGLSDFENQKIILFPNPTYSILNISTNIPIKTIKIFNELGQELFIQNSSTVIDLSNFATGVYNVQLETEEGIITKKVIKN